MHNQVTRSGLGGSPKRVHLTLGDEGVGESTEVMVYLNFKNIERQLLSDRV